MDLTHLILTRFSVRAHDHSPAPPRAWLEYRLRLFEAYCVPSFGNQTCQRFSWLVLCDESTGSWCVERLRELGASVPQLTVALTSPGRADVDAVLSRVGKGDWVLITTRVDSDDASSVDLVERVQAYAPTFWAAGHDAALLNFSRGFKLKKESGVLHDMWHPHSPHLTLFERLDSGRRPVTVLSGNHGFMQERYPLHVDAGPPVWVQVVHGGNVSNTVLRTDHEVPRSSLGDRFALAETDLGEPVAAPQPNSSNAQAAFRQGLEETLGDHDPAQPPR